MTLEALIGMIGGAVGIISGVVTAVTTIRSRRRDKWKKIEEDNDYAFLAALCRSS